MVYIILLVSMFLFLLVICQPSTIYLKAIISSLSYSGNLVVKQMHICVNLFIAFFLFHWFIFTVISIPHGTNQCGPIQSQYNQYEFPSFVFLLQYWLYCYMVLHLHTHIVDFACQFPQKLYCDFDCTFTDQIIELQHCSF